MRIDAATVEGEVLERMADIAIVVAPDGRILDANPAALKAYGYSLDEFTRLNVAEIRTGEEQVLIAAQLRDAAAAGTRFETRHRRSDGSFISVEVRATSVTVGGETAILSIIADITERVRAQERLAELQREKLQASEERFAAAFDQAAVGMAIIDADGRWQLVNDRICQMLGYTRGELSQMAFSDITTDDTSEEDRRRFQEMLTQPGSSYETEKRYVRADGSTFWAHLTATIVAGQDDRPNYAIDVIEDITDRKTAELALAAGEAHYRSLIESQRDLIVRFSPSNQLTFVNDAYSAAYGQTRAELEGAGVFRLVHPDDLSRTLDAIKSLDQPPHRVSWEHRSLTGEGWRWLSWEADAIRDEHDEIAEIQAIGRDVTERKSLEEQLVAQRDLGQALAITTTLDTALTVCLDMAIRLSHMDCGGIYLVDDATGDVRLARSRGLSARFIEQTRYFPAGSQHAALIAAGDPIYSRYEAVPVEKTDAEGDERLRGIGIIPIMHQGRAIGCFNLSSHTRDDVPETARANLEIVAAQVGSAIARVQAEEAWRSGQQEWQTLFDSLQEFLFVLDTEGTVLHINRVVSQRLGWAAEDIVGQNVLMVHPPESREEATSAVGEMVLGQRDGCSLPLYTKNGLTIPVETRITHGRWRGRDAMFGVSRDISARIADEVALQAANASLTARLAELRHRDEEFVLLREIGALLQLCGSQEEACRVIGRQMTSLFASEGGGLYTLRQSGEALETRLHWGHKGLEGQVFAPDDCWAMRRGTAHLTTGLENDLVCPHVGALSSAASLCVPLTAQGETLGILHLRGNNGELTVGRQQFVQTVADTIALALANLKLRESLREQSIHDRLTGLFNRRYMEETLGLQIAASSRARQSIGMIMIDIDHFKPINDNHGHLAGDAVLSWLGELLEASVRAGDVVCRFGGDEFAIVMLDTSIDLARARAEEVREAVADMRVMYEGHILDPVTLSLGVAVFPADGIMTDELIRAADAALYRAKEAGRDQVVTSV